MYIAHSMNSKGQRRKAQADAGTIDKLVQLARIGLPNMPFEARREFLEAIDLRCIMDGDQVELHGLITDAVISLAGKDSSEADTFVYGRWI